MNVYRISLYTTNEALVDKRDHQGAAGIEGWNTIVLDLRIDKRKLAEELSVIERRQVEMF